MKNTISRTLLATALAMGALSASAGTINYTAANNTWVYTGFEKTGAGNHTSGGFGELAGDGGTIVGGGSHFMWDGGSIGAGIGTYNWSTFTDYFFPVGYQVTVIGATWTNLEGRDINRGEGVFSYQQVTGAQLIGAHIAEGALLNGVFTLGASAGGRATWSYAALPAAPGGDVPEPASLALLGLGMLGLAASRRKA